MISAEKTGENQYNKLVNDLNNDTTDFTSWISNKKTILNTAKDIVDNFRYDEIAGWNTLNPYLNINNDDPDISRIYIGLASGKFITGGKWIPPDDYDPRTRVWYREAVEADDTIISDVYIDRESGDRTVTISSPLYIEGSFIGVISADIFMNNINNWLASQITDRNIYTYLLDHEGTVIVHTLKPELVGANIYIRDQLESFFEEPDAYLGYINEARNSSNIVRMEYIAEGRKTRGIIRKIEDGEWYISVAAVESNDILHFIKLNNKSIIFNVVIMGIVLVLLKLIINIKQELVKKNQLLIIDNERDFLTGIFNRRYFNLYMDNLWNTEDIYSEISLLMMDIDHFKGYNDTYGHIKGDEVLIEVTKAINDTIRKQDIFARYGGEEFVLVLEQVSENDAEKIAEKIIEAVYEADIENTSSPKGRITISIGIASMLNRKKLDLSQFTNRADQGFIQGKGKGT